MTCFAKTIFLSCAFAGVLCQTVSADEVVTRSGRSGKGSVTWDQGGFRLTSGEKSGVLPVTDVVEVRFGALESVTDVHSEVLTLTDGTLLSGSARCRSKGSKVDFKMTISLEVSFAYDRMISIDVRPMRRRSAGERPSVAAGQVLAIYTDGSVRGAEFSYLTAQTLGVKVDGARDRVRKSTVSRIFFQNAQPSWSDGMVVRTRAGDRLIGSIVSLDNQQLVFKSSVGELTIPKRELLSIELQDDRISRLTEKKPLEVKRVPYLETLYGPSFNKDLFGFPLRVGEVPFLNGVALHSRTEIFYDVKGQSVFLCHVGLDTRYSVRGAAKLVISCDGKASQVVDLVRAGPVVPIAIPLNGCSKLGIHLDYGPMGSSGDHGLVLNPRLIK